MDIYPRTVKPTRRSVYIRKRIHLRKSGKLVTEVKEKLKRSDNVQVSRMFLMHFYDVSVSVEIFL